MFTKQHYEKIAVALSQRFWTEKMTLQERKGMIIAGQALADMFANDNPNFDRQLFMHKSFGAEE